LASGPNGKPPNSAAAGTFAAEKFAVEKPASTSPRETLSRISCGSVPSPFQVELDSAAGELLDELGKPRRGLAEPGQMGAVDDGHHQAQGLGPKAGPGGQDNEQRGPQAKGRPGPRHYPLLVLVVGQIDVK